MPSPPGGRGHGPAQPDPTAGTGRRHGLAPTQPHSEGKRARAS